MIAQSFTVNLRKNNIPVLTLISASSTYFYDFNLKNRFFYTYTAFFDDLRHRINVMR